MPTAEVRLAPTAAPVGRIEVRTSIVQELVWALLIKDNEVEAEFPARIRRFEGAGNLAERIRGFWGDDGEGCFTEVLIVADRGRVLFTDDPDEMWAGLAEGAAAEPRFEPLTSETPEDQARFRARLDRLYRDPIWRDRWLGLLHDTWSAIETTWEQEGRNLAEALAWDVRAKIPEVGDYADLLPLVEGCDFDGLLPRLVEEAATAGQDVVVAPAWLGRRGILVSLRDRLLWGPPTPARPTGPSDEVRQRARRHKALGDPTRLAIFEATARRPRNVGELARELGVAQPTVSNHVRVLRDAGLLEQERGGGRRLAADLPSFERFLDEARRAVIPAPHPQSSGETSGRPPLPSTP